CRYPIIGVLHLRRFCEINHSKTKITGREPYYMYNKLISIYGGGEREGIYKSSMILRAAGIKQIDEVYSVER
ncbi:hypothetical protein, partial [Clostridium perfringens]|uniref:hypothetical protein n=1 Tax=Clostridium perfringens TaxID=1502 RepID=UPI002ACBE9B5